jgi:hypothetical protein
MANLVVRNLEPRLVDALSNARYSMGGALRLNTVACERSCGGSSKSGCLFLYWRLIETLHSFRTA